jgi:hypothetical protein
MKPEGILSHTISLWSILILSSHIYLGLPSGDYRFPEQMLHERIADTSKPTYSYITLPLHSQWHKHVTRQHTYVTYKCLYVGSKNPSTPIGGTRNCNVVLSISVQYLGRRHDKCIKILVGKPEGKRPLSRPRRRGKITLELILGK